ncbi:MAG: calcium-binding protein [Alphaproteobacteria bacterium]|nr:calcium-binding protein [Alphaproteobacteria bacterium]
MKYTKDVVLAAIAALGFAVVALPSAAQQTQMKPSTMMADQGGMMGANMDMMNELGGMMGMGMGMGMGMIMSGADTYAMTKFDTNEDGTLSPEEMSTGIQAELKTYDADANGTLSLDEFAVMHAAHTRPMTVRAFQMHDPDGDAQVTAEEMTAMAAMMQSHMSEQHNGVRSAGHGMMGNN